MLLRSFLEAAAGDYAPDATREATLTRLKNFISEERLATWDPGPDLTLVRVLDEPTQDGDTVKVTVQYVGTLDPEGQVEPGDGKVEQLRFLFKPVDGKAGLFLTNPPPVLLFDVAKLERFYLKLPIYFWNKNKTSLVPDLRYLPRALPAEQHSNRLVDWLLKGPSPAVKEAVLELPTGASRADLIIKDDTQIKVNLVAAASDADLEKLAIQLYWTLVPPETEERVLLRVNRNEYAVDFATARPWLTAFRPESEPRLYVIADGVLRRLKGSRGEQEPLLDGEKQNRGLVTAAVAHGERAFALVRQEGDTQRLYVRAAGRPTRQVAFPSPGVASLSGPVWLDRSAEVLMVLGDGKLWAVGARDTNASMVTATKGLPSGDITAFSVAPDGRRLALVIGGRLHMALLQRANATAGTFKIVEWQRVPVGSGFDGKLHGVGFIREDIVAVGTGGADEKVWLAEVTVDGALQKTYSTVQSGTVTNLTGYVEDGGRTDRPGKIMLDVNGKAYRAWPTQSFSDLEALVGKAVLPVPSPGPSASPSASPGTPAEASVSTAFFEG
ncbi:LpqB family beta-propeller domain-containing protein [Catellatospora sp. NPDC049609]|uniref:LpqB family beta-propeller domain-containing protein n=1 Tax=Catellatospora sp. NPDC049609 TaxID=3155505 RepID=UPI00342CB682